MGMAHSVEGRFPFLDHRVVELCNRLPANVKMLGLTEKYLLKRLSKKWLPEEISERPKRPYRAPIHRSFFNKSTPDYVRDVLSERRIKSTGFFKPQAVKQMIRKLDAGRRLGETDDMALAGIISSQLIHQQFVLDFRMPDPLTMDEVGKVCIGHNVVPNYELYGGQDGL
jgi:asparagine synthase (glutamine-hydrolysing)